MLDLYFIEESDYFEKNVSAPPFFNHFSLSLNRKKCAVMRAIRTKLNIVTLYLLHIRIENLDWCKCGHCKNEARDIDCLCCREMDAMLIVSAKIPECEGIILPSRFYGQLPDY